MAKLDPRRGRCDRLVNCGPAKLPFADGAFDAVIHARLEANAGGLERVLADARRVLRLDGILICPDLRVSGSRAAFDAFAAIAATAGFEAPSLEGAPANEAIVVLRKPAKLPVLASAGR